MNVNIIHTGSSGNIAVIDDTLIIDTGWKSPTPVKGMAVLITHAHSDHVKHLDDYLGLPIYATAETIDKLRSKPKFKYIAFSEIVPETFYKVLTQFYEYVFRPFEVNHDIPCVGYDITRRSYDGIDTKRIFFATDFNTLKDETRFIKNLENKKYDAIYVEANNTLTPTDLLECYISEDVDEQSVPKDEFHRRRSFQTHCNVGYLLSLFQRAGYSPDNKFTEPVTLLHKSSYYYSYNPEAVVTLCKSVNIVNPIY